MTDLSVSRHRPAFEHQIVDLLGITEKDIVLDCTLGDGSHTEEALCAGAQVISLDVDSESIDRAKKFIPRSLQKNWLYFRENFANLDKLFSEKKLVHPTIIIMDLGTSQFQLKNPHRGLSFLLDSPLDMRLDDRLSVTAKDLVNGLSQKELIRLFSDLGDETYAKLIARSIVNKRSRGLIKTTQELASLITAIKPSASSKHHRATKVFQSLRMAVNLERESLTQGLTHAFTLLQEGGRLGVISFHSGEDHLVKSFFRSVSKNNLGFLLSKKPILPSGKEILTNQKIRSAKLRLIQKNYSNHDRSSEHREPRNH